MSADGLVTRRLRTLLLIAAATAAAVVGTAPAAAQGAAAKVPAVTASIPSSIAPSGPSWQALSAAQRAILAPLERDWGTIDAPRKSKWLEVAHRFPAMRVADQQRVQERMAEWARMTPVERGRARLSFQESKQFSPEQKQARWEAYQALPDDERKALAIRSKPADERPRSAAAAASAALLPAVGKAGVGPKPAASAPAPKAVSPTVVQARPGATTTLMTTPVVPPEHHRPGQPKIAAKPGQVNPTTLLPQSGPQAAASAAATRP